MTALFKVARHDKPTERKIIRAATIDELISVAKIKLQLTNEKYKIYTDDFTDIDEDEILMELAKAKETKAEQLILTIVPDGIPWNFNALQDNTPAPSTRKTNETIPAPSSSTSDQTAKETIPSRPLISSEQTDDLSKIYPNFSTNIQSALRNGTILEPRDRRLMIHTVVEYIINDLKNTSRNTAENISKQIVKAYPKSFIVKIGNKNVDGEIEALRQTIYYAVHYQKGHSANTPQLSHSLDDTEEECFEKPKARDEYGCVAYLPNLPSSETSDSQEEKRLKLIECFTSADNTINYAILTLMRESYYSQRKEIHKEKNLSTIFEHWPYFQAHNKIIIQHADQLLGKETDKIWKESLNTLAKPINCWSRNAEIYREIKTKNKKSTSTPEETKYVRETLKSAKAYCNMVKNDEPYHNVIFGFIVKFMKEDMKFLNVLINEEVTNDELIQHVPVVNPVLMIRGQDLHHSENVYDVVIEKKIIIQVQSFLDGLLTTFLCYYVFGIAYPTQIEGTLEAIQRLFLKICPPKGTKRGGKRKATNIHPKITTMTKELEPYIKDDGSEKN